MVRISAAQNGTSCSGGGGDVQVAALYNLAKAGDAFFQVADAKWPFGATVAVRASTGITFVGPTSEAQCAFFLSDEDTTTSTIVIVLVVIVVVAFGGAVGAFLWRRCKTYERL